MPPLAPLPCTHSAVSGIAHACIAIMGNLAVEEGVRAAVLPAMASVQRATQRHVASAEIAESSLKLFRSMSQSHRLHSMRCVNTLLLCLKQHPSVPAVARWSMATLDNLAYEAANKVPSRPSACIVAYAKPSRHQDGSACS